jgi:hypothetical protein
MKEQNLVHVRIGYEEGVQAKKDLLSSERDFLRILKIIKKYHLLRKAELTNKLRLQNKMKELKANLGKLNETLPKIKVPSILKRESIQEEDTSKKTKEEKKEKDLESQLREIQDRLRKLG